MSAATTSPDPVIIENDSPVSQGESLASLVEEGKSSITSGDLRGALECYKTAVKLYPAQPEGHNNLGAMYSSLGEFKKAEHCFDRVLELLPDNTNVLYNRGIVRSQQEKFDLAREDFLAVSKTNPEDADSHNNLGVTAYMQGHLAAARKHFKKALKLEPSYTSAVINLCDVEVSDGNLAQAVTTCEYFLSQNHDLEVRRKHLDLLSTGCQQALDKASVVAEKLLVNDSNNTNARMQLGRLTQARTALIT
jgi:Tfp pilus assembly protein PilF